jgi:four helix bundle protein
MKDYKELDVWQRAVSMVGTIYRLVGSFPQEERFGLIDQIKRSAVSIPSNIAEGAGRHGTKEFAKYLAIACGSINELETQLIIAHRLGFCLDDAAPLGELRIIRKQLNALIKSLRTASEKY